MATILIDHDDTVVTLTLNRPEKLNALNAELLGELAAAINALPTDASVRCVIMTGAGEKAFAAGADIAAMSEMTPVQAKHFADVGHGIGRALEQLAVPVIAAVN